MTGAEAKMSALCPAAGAGTRLGLGPKALLEVDGKPLLRLLADKLLRVADEVVLAVPAEMLARFAAAYPDCRCIAGGESRQDSVRLLAEAATHDRVLLHDAARPFASEALLREVAAAGQAHGCASAFLDPEVPVARIVAGVVKECIARDEAGIFQSPQSFSRDQLVDLVRTAEHRGWREQSTIQLAVRAGIAVRSVRGEKTNIKLTTREDWAMAGHLAEMHR